MKIISPKQAAGRILLYLCFIFTAILLFFPFYWIIVTSLKEPGAIYAQPPQLLPYTPTLENYRLAIADSGILHFSLNSLWISSASMLLTILVGVMAVYPMTRLKFRGKKLFVGLLACTQVFPIVVTIVPLYILFRRIGLYNSFSSLILTYTATCVPVAIVLLSGYFRDIPFEMEEAATIDGCGRLKLLFTILLPISRPGIVATGIYVFLSNWQEYLAAFSLISKREKYTLTLGLTLFQTEHSTNWGALMATAVVLAVPAILLFFGIEKFFIDSLAGSVKE